MNLRGEAMKASEDKSKKPFYVGQLVRFVEPLPDPADHGLDIVLDLKWRMHPGEWYIYVLSQQTGKKQWLWAEDFVPVEKNK